MDPAPAIDAANESLLVAATRVAIGAYAFVYAELQKAVVPNREPHVIGRRAYVVIGSLVTAEERAISITSRVGGAIARPAGVVARSRLAAPIAGVMRELEARGRAEMTVANAESARVFSSVLERAGRSQAVVDMVDTVVDEVIWPIIDKVLPGVLERLQEDPEPIQSLVLNQSTSIAGELAGVARDTAARADDRVASVVDRILRRNRNAVPPPAPSLP